MNRRENWAASAYPSHVNYHDPARMAGLPPNPPLWPEYAAQRIERRWTEYEVICEQMAGVNDDRVPSISNITGTEIFAEAFGCKVHRPDDNMPFALPFVTTPAEADRLKKPSLSGSSLAYLFDIADELYRRGGPGTIMKMVDLQSPMDTVALIWDKSNLFMAMIEAPESVKALAAKVHELLVEFLAEWFRRYGTTHVSHHPYYVMHGGVTLSVDEVGAVSSEMFNEFFRTELVSLSETFGGLGVHCCAAARHQWENFSRLPGLKVMNHHHPAGSTDASYMRDSLLHYGRAIVQVPAWGPRGPYAQWLAQFPGGARLVLETSGKDADDASRIAEELRGIQAACKELRHET